MAGGQIQGLYLKREREREKGKLSLLKLRQQSLKKMSKYLAGSYSSLTRVFYLSSKYLYSVGSKGRICLHSHDVEGFAGSRP